jgi:hypothetical protein
VPCCEAAYTVGFAGRSLSDEQPALTIPNGINPQEIILVVNVSKPARYCKRSLVPQFSLPAALGVTWR